LLFDLKLGNRACASKFV